MYILPGGQVASWSTVSSPDLHKAGQAFERQFVRRECYERLIRSAEDAFCGTRENDTSGHREKLITKLKAASLGAIVRSFKHRTSERKGIVRERCKTVCCSTFRFKRLMLVELLREHSISRLSFPMTIVFPDDVWPGHPELSDNSRRWSRK